MCNCHAACICVYPFRVVEQLASQLTALELDAGKGSVAEEGKEKAADGGDAGKGKAYLSLEEYKEATAAGTPG